MPRVLVVSQPMFLPWIGLFEQVRLADFFIHYDDVQLPQGRSFMSRVQVKTATGSSWLTAPIDRGKSGPLINEVVFASDQEWRDKHLRTIRHAYARAPHFDEMFNLVAKIYSYPSDRLFEFNINAVQQIAFWLGLSPQFRRSSETGVTGSSTQRLVDLCRLVAADTYVTGLGALRYLDHEKFEAEGIAVRYMDYRMTPYPQQHGEFTPYVSIIDAVANCGSRAIELIRSETVGWRECHVARK